MAKDKRDPQLETAVRLQEVLADGAAEGVEAPRQISLIEMMMEQIAVEFEAMPTAAQLSVLRALVPSLLEELDREDREYWTQELLGVTPKVTGS